MLYNNAMANELKKTEQEIHQIEDNMLTNRSYEKLADFYAIFGDKTRLILICILAQHELCVNDLAQIMGMSQSRVSHQLAVLREADIVTSYRKGKSVLYSLTDNHIKDMVKIGIEHVSEKDEELYIDRRKKGL